MLALVIAALVTAQAPTTSPATAPADPPEKTSAEKLVDARNMYVQSCAARAYGAYDDLCDNLKHQIGEYERTVAKEERAAKNKPATVQPVAAVKPQN